MLYLNLLALAAGGFARSWSRCFGYAFLLVAIWFLIVFFYLDRVSMKIDGYTVGYVGAVVGLTLLETCAVAAFAHAIRRLAAGKRRDKSAGGDAREVF